MKICLLTHTLPRFEGDPSAPFIHVLAQSLVSLGHKVTVLAPFDPEIDKNTKRTYKLVTYKYIFPEKLHILGYSHTLIGDKTMSLSSYLISPFLYVFGFFALLNLVKKTNPDVISSHWILPNGFIAALVSKITKVPFTVTIPGSDVYMAGKNFLFRLMAGFASNSASVVISDSKYYLGQLNSLGYFPIISNIIRYGVDIERFNIIKDIKSKTPIILGVGRMVAKKGFKYLVKAMVNIIKVIPKAELILVGDGEERVRLENMARKLNISSNIKFVGMIPYTKLSDYYSIANAFVMPSIKDEDGNIDASPVAMMEAMCMGIPVVATDLAGDSDLIIDGITGYMVRPKNVDGISESVIKLLKEKDNLKIRKKIREIAKLNFSSIVIAKKYTKCFDDSILT